VRNGTNWSQQAYLKPSNLEGGSPSGDQFGFSVAMAGNTVVVGAFLEDSNAAGVNGDQNNNAYTNSGAAYIFVREGTNWSQQAYLKASNPDTIDWFGYTVAVSGNTVVIGSYREDSNATGVNGDQSNNSATGAGAAYVFVRNGATWSQQSYLKASNTDIGDAFGGAVAISGGTVVVGAAGEASSATGVNGNQASNGTAASGATYVFSGLDFGSQLKLEPDNLGGYFVRFEGHAGFTNYLERSPNLTGYWITIDTQIVPASGLVEFHDQSPLPGQAFYRKVQP
jgi:drug/metabolite transporter superfamily protein YnfA